MCRLETHYQMNLSKPVIFCPHHPVKHGVFPLNMYHPKQRVRYTESAWACTGRRNRMSKTSKTAKCPLPKRIRKRLEITIDPENHDYLKKIGVNVSRLVDKAIYGLRKVTPSNLILISQNKPEEWARPDSDRRSPPCQGDVITS